MIHLGLLGSSGRMGTLIAQLIQSEFQADVKIVASARRGDSLESLLSTDVIIDVSLPAVVAQLASLAIKKSTNLPKFLIGSTGWTPETHESIKALSGLTPVLVSSNFSVGIYALSSMLKDYSPLFKKLGYTPVILESHHRHKKDSPSGTAKSLQKSIDPVHPDRIQTHSVRAGEVIGDHAVTFFSAGDQITLSHHAQDRSIFARGAIQVAQWLAQSPHSPNQILGMEDYFASLKPQSLGALPHGKPI